MKKFEIPEQFTSAFTGKIKQWRKMQDPRKKDFAPSIVPLEDLTLIFPRHMGFCYGVENAIEIAFKAVSENPGKRVFLLKSNCLLWVWMSKNTTPPVPLWKRFGNVPMKLGLKDIPS